MDEEHPGEYHFAISRPDGSSMVVPDRGPDAVYVAFFKHDKPAACCCYCGSGGSNVLGATTGILYYPFECLVSCVGRCISPKYEHCQLVFRWFSQMPSETVTMTFSTTKRSPSAHLSTRYADTNWRVISVKSLNAQTKTAAKMRSQAWKWSCEHSSAPFNYRGYYLNNMPLFTMCPYDSGGKTFYCAEQVAMALVDVGALDIDDINPHTSTPDSVYTVLVANGGVVDDVRAVDIVWATEELGVPTKQTVSNDRERQKKKEKRTRKSKAAFSEAHVSDDDDFAHSSRRVRFW